MIDGLAADVVTLALAADIDAIATRSGKIPADWQKRRPNNSAPYTSTIVFLVRKGNPKAIKEWDDLAKPGVAVITPNPKTSGGARWNYLAAWGYGLKKFGGDEARVKDFVKAIYKNAPVMDTGARGSTITFAQRGLGDVLITWENRGLPRAQGVRRGQVPDRRAQAVHPRRAAGLGRRRQRRIQGKSAACGSLSRLPLLAGGARRSLRKTSIGPCHPEHAAKEDLKKFPKLELITIDKTFGGWAAAQKKHFADGGIFDEIQKQEPAR